MTWSALAQLPCSELENLRRPVPEPGLGPAGLQALPLHPGSATQGWSISWGRGRAAVAPEQPIDLAPGSSALRGRAPGSGRAAWLWNRALPWDAGGFPELGLVQTPAH